MEYEIEEHKHRFSAWAAGRAASVNGCRFTVEQAQVIIEAVGLRQYIQQPDNLPGPDDVDLQHKIWRTQIIDAANNNGLAFSHGIAAKLINIYLKSAIVCGGHHTHEKAACQHPPIDRVLLDELSRRNLGGFRRDWAKDRDTGWSNFSSDQYQSVIDRIRKSIHKTPLWKIEQYWQGYQ